MYAFLHHLPRTIVDPPTPGALFCCHDWTGRSPTWESWVKISITFRLVNYVSFAHFEFRKLECSDGKDGIRFFLFTDFTSILVATSQNGKILSVPNCLKQNSAKFFEYHGQFGQNNFQIRPQFSHFFSKFWPNFQFLLHFYVTIFSNYQNLN